MLTKKGRGQGFRKKVFWGVTKLSRFELAECCCFRPGKTMHQKRDIIKSVADVKMEIPVLIRSLKSSILGSTGFQMDETFWGVVNAAVEQSAGNSAPRG